MSYERHDEALKLLIDYGPDLTSGMTSHVPMVAEALAAMGQGRAAIDWVARHRHSIVPRTQAPLQGIPDLWPAALGRHERNAEWSAFFSREISEHGWQATCDRWGRRLAPGFAAAATHGVIRTGHAARALAQRVTDMRLKELADGLALWASAYKELPAKPGTAKGLSPIEALKRVQLVPESDRRNEGSITAALGQLKFAPGFAEAINFTAVGATVETSVLDAAEAFAHVVVQNVSTPLGAIVFTHGVTGMLAVRNLLPHVSVETGQLLFLHGWHTGAGLHSAYATSPFKGVADCGLIEDVDRVARAVAHGDDHVIKMTEACLNFLTDRPAKAFLKASDVVAQHLEPEPRH